MEGSAHAVRGQGDPSYMPGVDPGRHGGLTYTAQATEPTIDDYANVFGPSARDIKSDLQRYKRHGRWHLPDALKGPNQWLTDRVDGLITDATNSPFTTRILPYKYIPNPDGKFKWNVWSFDEGMASRVPYESAARTLTQTKRSFAGYTVRQGLAIALEHNFMMSEKGRENFRNQLQQLVGSIQYTNDLDVHIALILAPSYESTLRDRYYIEDKTPTQVCREYVDLFGFIQKNQNALDIMIEEGKARLKSWGGPLPDFLLCNSKLTFQLTMTPEKTNYLTQGIDGVKRLRAGPDISSYRGINIIHSRCFSMDPGTPPRDILRRRVRVAEYYRILPHKDNHKREFQFYNEERDTWFTYSFKDLLGMAKYTVDGAGHPPGPGRNNHQLIDNALRSLNNLHASAGGLETIAPGARLAAMEIDENEEDDEADAPGARGIARIGSHMQMPAPGTRLALDIDATNPASIRNLCSQVVMAALKPNWPNWTPQGEFIAPNIVFAMGAVNWNEFWVTCNNDFRTGTHFALAGAPAPWPNALAYQNPTNDPPGGALGVPRWARGPNPGNPQYIPAEKYYFPTINNKNDLEMDSNGRPYGVNKCLEYRNSLRLSKDHELNDLYGMISEAYPDIDGTQEINWDHQHITAGGAGGPLDRVELDTYLETLAVREQAKVGAALLFQAICEYPRNINAFYNESARDFFTSGRYLDRGLFNNFGISADLSFAESLRFHVYMRYGVSKNILTNSIYDVAGGTPFPHSQQAFRTGNAVCPDPTGANPNPRYLPWNKIQGAQRNAERYSAFDITKGIKSRNYDNLIPGGTAVGPDAIVTGAITAAYGAGNKRLTSSVEIKSGTIFEYSQDNGNAFLREIGAFLSPNHFHPQNDAFNYSTVGSFLGAHIIVTHETSKALMKTQRGVPLDSRTSFFNDTLMHYLITNRNALSDEEVNKIFNLINAAWREKYTVPEETLRAYRAAPPPAPAAGGAPAAAAPLGSNFTRLDLTTHFIGDGQPNDDDTLSLILDTVAERLGFANDHQDHNCVWTWPRVLDTAEEVFASRIDDFRLHADGNTPTGYLTGAAAWVAPAAAGTPANQINGDQAKLNGYFPSHQVGNFAVKNWQRNLNDYANLAGTTALSSGVVLNTPAAVNAYKNNWAFSKIITARPATDRLHHRREEVMAFLYQIFTRYCYDQSDEPVIHADTAQFADIAGPFPYDPTALPRRREPFYGGMPGGMFNRRFPDLAPEIPDGYMSGGPGARRRRGGPGGPGGGGPGGGGGGGGGGGRLGHGLRDAQNIELVIVRPNIEHQMLGIIMGKGGEELGNTLWGQTELSCYDDSMHGIWGMSYKYHERAIVFNEKNLIRLWDVAYDGYSGGKDATYVEWDNARKVNEFKSATNDISQNYKGPSMMVMAFCHNQNSPEHRNHFRRNWPSPIVFHDDHNFAGDGHGRLATAAPRLAADPNNSHSIDTSDMRVFNNPLYSAYQSYYEMMPNFSSLHQVRKPAGPSAHENETFCDSLAFQGTMKVYEDGREVEHIQGSGHHGPDWIGVASIRSGKGYKIASQPGLARLV